ncbi:hypothetical protein OSB04_021996, partial [Centaurea solstitialis]
MISQSSSAGSEFSQVLWLSSSPICPCKRRNQYAFCSFKTGNNNTLISRNRVSKGRNFSLIWVCVVPSGGERNHDLNLGFVNSNSTKRGAKSYVVERISNELVEGGGDDGGLSSESSIPLSSSNNFTNFREDPIVDKLRTQLGVIHPIPSPPINRNIVGLFVFFFFVGVVFDKVWTSRKKKKSSDEARPGIWPQVPTSFSLFLEKDLQRKESVEWVNMVLGKLWKVYRGGLENWVIGLLQPVIDNLQKPDYVERVEIKQFSLGNEPLSVRNVERRTSRRVNDLQYQIGLRYTGGARMLLMLSLKFGIIPIKVPVGVRDFDIDGELWVKLRLIPSEPWVGAASWAFVSLPKIKFELSPFRFLTKLLTEDLPRLFVRPKKIVLDFQKGKSVGPVRNDFKTGETQEGNKDFVGELSVTLVDARKLSYPFYGKTDPYVVLRLGDQVIRSKKNSQTTVIGPPGEPIWNQDFYMLVTNPRKQRLSIQVKDSLGFADTIVGTGEVDLGSLKDTVPTDKIVALQGGWGLFRKKSAGEILLRLTYKAYVEDEEDEKTEAATTAIDASDDEMSDLEQAAATYGRRVNDFSRSTGREAFMDVLAELLVSEEFRGIVASETANAKSFTDVANSESTERSRGATVAAPDLPNSESASRVSVLLWLAVITSISIVIAINVGGS